MKLFSKSPYWTCLGLALALPLFQASPIAQSVSSLARSPSEIRAANVDDADDSHYELPISTGIDIDDSQVELPAFTSERSYRNDNWTVADDDTPNLELGA